MAVVRVLLFCRDGIEQQRHTDRTEARVCGFDEDNGQIRTESQPPRIERIWAGSRKKILVRLDCRNKRRRQNAALRESPPTANADGVRVFGTFPIRGCCAVKIKAVGL